VAFGVQREWGFAGINALLLASSLLNLWRVRTTGETVVSTDGLRVRRGFAWRSVSWDEVDAIERQKNIFDVDTGIWVKTKIGEAFLVSVPPRLRDELADYAEAHRTPGSQRG
jgi:hypothetical protein